MGWMLPEDEGVSTADKFSLLSCQTLRVFAIIARWLDTCSRSARLLKRKKVELLDKKKKKRETGEQEGEGGKQWGTGWAVSRLTSGPHTKCSGNRSVLLLHLSCASQAMAEEEGTS